MASIKQLEDIIHSLRKMNKSLLDDLLTLQEDKKLTNIQLNVALQSREKFESKHEQGKLELERLKKKLEDQSANMGELENDNNKLQTQLLELKKDLEFYNQNNIKLMERIEKISTENSHLTEKIDKMDKLKSLDNEKSIEMHNEKINALNEKITKLELDKSKWDKLKQEETKKRIEAEQYSKGLEKRAQELEDRVDKADKLLVEMKSQQEAHKSSSSQLDSELNLFKTLFEKEQRNREKIEEDFNAMKKQLSLLEAESKSDKERIQQLDLDSKELVVLKRNNDSRDFRVADLMKQLELEQLKNQSLIENHQKEIISFKNIKNNLNQQIESLVQKQSTINCNSLENNNIIIANNETISPQSPNNNNNPGIINKENNSINEEKEHLKEWESRLDRDNQYIVEQYKKVTSERITLEREKEQLVKDKTTLELGMEKLKITNNDSYNSMIKYQQQAKRIEELLLVKSSLELKIDELLKNQQNHHTIPTPSISNTISSSSSSNHTSLNLSPSKNTFTSIFSRKNNNNNIDKIKNNPVDNTQQHNTENNQQQNNNSNNNNISPPNSNNSTPIISLFPTVDVNITDQERKLLLFKTNQTLLDQCCDLLYQKRDRLDELEKEGFSVRKVFQIQSIKQSIAKIEPIQDSLKKSLKVIDAKPTITIADDIEERNHLKLFELEMENEKDST